ncbi:MAG: hypothetical protein ACYDB7_02620 [Mycobacteriales bacterium]
MALVLVWPRPILLVECDPAGGDLLAGYLAGADPPGGGLLGLALAARHTTLGGGDVSDRALASDSSGARLVLTAPADGGELLGSLGEPGSGPDVILDVGGFSSGGIGGIAGPRNERSAVSASAADRQLRLCSDDYLKSKAASCCAASVTLGARSPDARLDRLNCGGAATDVAKASGPRVLRRARLEPVHSDTASRASAPCGDCRADELCRVQFPWRDALTRHPEGL